MASEERLTAATATCPVCLSILVEPVTMPCQHTLCGPCFDSTVEQASLACPLCRTRISVWLRRARRSGSLVDQALWARLQRDFPAKVEARLQGRDADFSEEDLEPVPLHLSEPGEIRQEFEQQMASVMVEEEDRRVRSERASRELIDRLQDEAAARAEQEARDEELARGVMREEELFVLPSVPGGGGDRKTGTGGDRKTGAKQRPSSTPVRGPMDVYIGQLTPRVGGKRPVSPIRPRSGLAGTASGAYVSPTGSCKENSDPAVAAERTASAMSTASADSIGAEFSHFKPIRTVPRTPPKRRLDGGLVEPALVHTVPRHLNHQPASSSVSERRPPATRRGLNSEEIRARLTEEEEDPLITDGAAAGGTKRPADAPPPERRPRKRPAPSPAPAPDAEIDLTSAELLEEQRRAERQLQLELADRRLAEQLQRELNRQQPVDRSKGSADAYSLRRPAGQRRPQRRDRSQLSIQESLRRSRGRAGR